MCQGRPRPGEYDAHGISGTLQDRSYKRLPNHSHRNKTPECDGPTKAVC